MVSKPLPAGGGTTAPQLLSTAAAPSVSVWVIVTRVSTAMATVTDPVGPSDGADGPATTFVIENGHAVSLVGPTTEFARVRLAAVFVIEHVMSPVTPATVTEPLGFVVPPGQEIAVANGSDPARAVIVRLPPPLTSTDVDPFGGSVTVRTAPANNTGPPPAPAPVGSTRSPSNSTSMPGKPAGMATAPRSSVLSSTTV